MFGGYVLHGERRERDTTLVSKSASPIAAAAIISIYGWDWNWGTLAGALVLSAFSPNYTKQEMANECRRPRPSTAERAHERAPRATLSAPSALGARRRPRAAETPERAHRWTFGEAGSRSHQRDALLARVRPARAWRQICLGPEKGQAAVVRAPDSPRAPEDSTARPASPGKPRHAPRRFQAPS